MGKYINIGNAEFESVRKDEYVDKSMLIAYVNKVLGTQRKFLCVTRARRFGKSIAAKMLNAYYDQSCDSHALFHDLNIAKDPSCEQHLNKYPVIYLDASGFTSELTSDRQRVVYEMNDALSKELRKTYPDVPFEENDTLPGLLLSVVGHTRKQFIMIVDEWDAILREMDDETVIRQYVDWLRSMFKTSFTDRIFAGVYMTGILPIKQYNTESALNNFEEFSMINPGPLAGFFGFTKEEVRELCRKFKMDPNEIRAWYDGYEMGDVKEVYNPFAVMRALNRGTIDSYWTATTTYESLKRYISMNFEGLKDSVVELLAGNEVRVDVGRFANDIHEINSRDAVLTLLIHLGYLSYDRNAQKVRIPNEEVRREFERTIKDGSWGNLTKLLNQSEQLLADTLAGNAKTVAAAIDDAHQDNTSILQYNDENSLACVLSLAYVAARKDYTMIRELPTGKGFADIVLLPNRNVDKPALVLELKFNHSTDTAIAQIKEQRYAGMLLDYVGNVLLVGINYDKKTKHHECIIERLSQNVATNVAINSKSGDKCGDKSLPIGDRNKQRILEYIAQHPEVKSQEIAEVLGLGISRTKVYLSELADAGLILRLGANKDRTYKLK